MGTIDDTKQFIEDQKYAIDQSAIVAITDPKGRIIYVNKKFEEISGYSSSELLGNDHRMINSGRHSGKFFKDLWATISSGKVWNGEIQNRGKSGHLYWVDTTIVPMVGPDGKPEQYIAIRFDITAKKQVQDELTDERARAVHAEKMASLGIMASGIAHELGNPLGALRGRAEMLRDQARAGNVDAEKVELTAEKLLALSDRMNKIIRGLRAYARDGSKDPFSNINLYGLVSDITELSKAKCRTMDIALEVNCPNMHLHVEGRETEVGQVLVNLLNNAMDAVKNLDQRWIRIDIEESKVDLGQVEIKVTDSGNGIDEDTVKKMLDPFFTTKPVGQGTGLGLSISNTIISSHGGEFTYDQNNSNTCFIVKLPIKQITQQGEEQ